MQMLFAMTLPALVLLLTVLGAVELVRGRRDRKGCQVMAATGFDILQQALYPSKKFEIEQRESESLMAEEDDDGAPPRTQIDLDRGTARVQLPRTSN